MGKIRTKLIGAEDVEEKQKKEAQARREAKKLLKEKKEPEAKEVKTVEPKVEENEVEENEVQMAEKKKKSKQKVIEVIKKRGKKYLTTQKLVNEKKKYSYADAIELVKKMKYSKFDESVELHLNLLEDNVKGEVNLPAGTGKTVRVVVLDDKVVADIEDGKIDFDVLITTPSMMPKLVKFAKVLGPKGLMPSPKNGTVTDKPEEAVKKFSGGTIRFKSEPKFPIIHQSIGKLSFKSDDLSKNISAFITAVGKKNIESAFVCATMTPSVQLVVEEA